MLGIIRDYKHVERPVLYLVVAEFFIQLINSSFMVIQPLYMKAEGFDDGSTAGYISYRFLGVLLLALPVGLFIKKRRLKPLFYLSSFAVPTFALLIIFSIHEHIHWLINVSQFLWGSSFTFLQICSLPFILRNAKKETHTEAIALNYSTWSFAGILGGFIIGVLSWYNASLFNEENILIIISILGYIGVYFVYKISIKENVPTNETIRKEKMLGLWDFDWVLITKSMIPTVIIAVGAGLTIPFMSLFFSNVHNMSTGTFSVVTSITSILVAICAMLVPRIKRGIGYKVAVPATQSVAVISLFCLATTQYYSQYPIAVYIAIFCFMIRQPLMNLASPMTSEIVMSYVGSKNREMVSALTSAIWSGSWFISSRIFKVLRDGGHAYVSVFLITATLYAIGVVWYYFLILDYDRREQAGLIEK